MTDIALLDDLFFNRTGMDKSKVRAITGDALHNMDDGELFLEYSQSESFSFDDGQLKNASFNNNQGFGLRSVLGEAVGYSYSSELSEDAIKRAAKTVKAVNYGQPSFKGEDQTVFGSNRPLYSDVNPLGEVEFAVKIQTLQAIDSYLRSKDSRVRQVSASLLANWQAVKIIRGDGKVTGDIRPLVRLNISVVVEENGRMESGSHGAGARTSYSQYIDPQNWQKQADKALAQALVNLSARPTPAGEMPVIIGNAWCGVLLHEAIGHGLEGDFNRKKTSVFSEMMGKQVASKGVTIVDDGTISDRRGSLSIDDEGTPSGKTTLIEDGILTGYMQDRLNARLMGVKATGNGRRENYMSQPLPRMTNTYMLAGNDSVSDMIASVKRGLYAVNFGGGQVDITSGKFVFSASEAYMIEDGKIAYPVKGATLIGSGSEAMKKITAIGNDFALDDGVGTCGKAGQSVPVGVGQPSVLISSMTVGGTEI